MTAGGSASESTFSPSDSAGCGREFIDSFVQPELAAPERLVTEGVKAEGLPPLLNHFLRVFSALPRKLEPDFCVICVSAVMRANAGSKTTSSNRAFISSSMHLSAGCSNGKPSRIVGQQLVKGMSSSANKCHDRKSEDSLDRKDTGLAAPKAACSDAALAAQGQASQ